MPTLKRKRADGTWEYIQLTGVDVAELRDVVDEHVVDEKAHGIGDKTTLQTTHKSTIVGAVNELFTNVSNGKSLVGGAITDVDDSIVIPTDPTFQDLANGIGKISTGKKWASGNFLNVGAQINKEIRGLEFRPSSVFCFLENNLDSNNINITHSIFDLSNPNLMFKIPYYSGGYTVRMTFGYRLGSPYFASSTVLDNNAFYEDGFNVNVGGLGSAPDGATIGWVAIE